MCGCRCLSTISKICKRSSRVPHGARMGSPSRGRSNRVRPCMTLGCSLARANQHGTARHSSSSRSKVMQLHIATFREQNVYSWQAAQQIMCSCGSMAGRESNLALHMVSKAALQGHAAVLISSTGGLGGAMTGMEAVSEGCLCSCRKPGLAGGSSGAVYGAGGSAAAVGRHACKCQGGHRFGLGLPGKRAGAVH